MPRDDDAIEARRREESRRAKSAEYTDFSYGVVRPLMVVAAVMLFGVMLLVAGPSTERRLVGLGLTAGASALAVPGWRWYWRRWHQLSDPPRLRNEFPLRTVDLLAIAFMFAMLGLLCLFVGSTIVGVLLLIAAAGVCLLTRS